MTTTPLPPPGVNIAAGNWTAVTDCRYYTADQMQAYAHQARADLEAANARLREALRKVLGAVQEYLPPDGIDVQTAMGRIIEVVDPWPDQQNPTAAPVAQQYEAGDVASAAAQGFREGVASVAQQPHDQVVVTWDAARTRILAVTRQDEEGRILKVIAEAPAQQPQAEATERESFEAWARYFSTLPVDRDAHGYIDMNVQMMWHAWQAAKKNAPEGASWGESSFNTRLGLARPDSTCQHQFALQPSSGMLLCANCGLSEVAAKKAARAQPQQAEMLREHLRDAQVAATMPLIGPLLDAWDGLPNDLKCEEELSNLRKQIRAINMAMEGVQPQQAEAVPSDVVCDKDPQGCWNVRCQLGKVCKNAAIAQQKGQP